MASEKGKVAGGSIKAAQSQEDVDGDGASEEYIMDGGGRERSGGAA